MQQSEEEHAERIRQHFQPNEIIAASIQRITETAEILHAVEAEQAESDTDKSLRSQEFDLALRPAQDLDAAVSWFSIALIRQQQGEQIFQSAVVEYCGFCTLTEHVYSFPQQYDPLHATVAGPPLLR